MTKKKTKIEFDLGQDSTPDGKRRDPSGWHYHTPTAATNGDPHKDSDAGIPGPGEKLDPSGGDGREGDDTAEGWRPPVPE